MIGVEPDPDLLPTAQRRIADLTNAEARSGSAEDLPLDAHSVDVAHARFAYFFGAGSEAGLDEVRRVVRPGGVFAAVDNDWGWGEFADLLRASDTGNATLDPDATHDWWMAQGATRTDVRAGWKATSPAELERILRIEFPAEVVDDFVARRPPSAELTYGVALFTLSL